MLIKKMFIFILMVSLLAESASVITNCLFINTVNISDLQPNENNTYFFNNIEIPDHFVGAYNYDIYENGSTYKTDLHKRGCICPDPCLSVCSNYTSEFYDNNQENENLFVVSVILENDLVESKHIFLDFHHRIGLRCNERHSKFYLNAVDNEDDEWSLFMNGTLLIQYDKTLQNQNHHCFEITRMNEEGAVSLMPYFCSRDPIVSVELRFKNLAMLCSTPFFLLTIVIYWLCPINKECHNKCFIMCLAYLALSYGFISFVTLSGLHFSKIVCIVIGYTIYYLTISFLIWTCILSYETMKVLTHMADTENSAFGKYSIWGYSLPLLALVLTFIAQNMIIYDELKPGISELNCGINTYRWSAAIYYYGPLIIVFGFCFVMLIRVQLYVWNNKENCPEKSSERNHNSFVMTFIRILIFMGVTWILDIISYFYYLLYDESLIIFVADFCTAIHGIIVFLLFVVCSKDTRDRIKNKISNTRKLKRREGFETRSAIQQKYSFDTRK